MKLIDKILVLMLCGLVSVGFSADTGKAGHDDINKLLADAEQFFREANKTAVTNPDQAAELYKKAIMRYERIVTDGGIRNGMLYYNIGNAYFKLGDIGRAILFYRRAEQYIPNDINLRRNLRFVLSMRDDRIEQNDKSRILKTLFFWHYRTPFRVRAGLFLFTFSLVWIAASVSVLLSTNYYKKQEKSLLLTTMPPSPSGRGEGVRVGEAIRWWIVLAAVVCSSVLFVSLAAETIELAGVRPGVILNDQVVPRTGDGEAYEKSFEQPLHAGSEFVLVEERGLWSHIKLMDGRKCWVPTRTVAFVREKNETI